MNDFGKVLAYAVVIGLIEGLIQWFADKEKGSCTSTQGFHTQWSPTADFFPTRSGWWGKD